MITPKLRDFVDKDLDLRDFNDIMYLVRHINTYGDYQYSINILTMDCEVHLPNNEIVTIDGNCIWSIIETIYKAVEYTIDHINSYHCDDAGLIAKELRLQYQLKDNKVVWNDVNNTTHYEVNKLITSKELLTDEVLLIVYDRLASRSTKVEYNYDSIIKFLKRRYYYVHAIPINK